jgi:hypothetical protein
MRIVFVAVVCGLAVAGCAKDADRGSAGYVATTGYESYTCAQLAEQASLVSSHSARAAAQDYSGDRIAMEVGRVVFFPILVFEKGNYPNPFELARLRKTMDEIEQASIQNNCEITFEHAPPPSQASPRRGGPK